MHIIVQGSVPLIRSVSKQDNEKLSQVYKGTVNYLSLPNNIAQAKYHSWWTWMTNGACKIHRHDPLESTSITVIEYWSYDDRSLADCRAASISDKELREWALKEFPTHNGSSPRAGLKLIYGPQVQDQLPFAKDTVAAINDSFSLPQIYIHATSRKSGFLGRLSGANGESSESNKVTVYFMTDISSSIHM
jgi:hypothetical protein